MRISMHPNQGILMDFRIANSLAGIIAFLKKRGKFDMYEEWGTAYKT